MKVLDSCEIPIIFPRLRRLFFLERNMAIIFTRFTRFFSGYRILIGLNYEIGDPDWMSLDKKNILKLELQQTYTRLARKNWIESRKIFKLFLLFQRSSIGEKFNDIHMSTIGRLIQWCYSVAVFCIYVSTSVQQKSYHTEFSKF